MATALARRAPVRFVRRRPAVLVRRAGPRRKTKVTVPLAVALGMVPGAAHVYSYRGSGAQVMANQAMAVYTGFRPGDSRWYPGDMAKGMLPLVMGFAVHKAASQLGFNRMLARSGVPFFRI